jgi:tripartite-type tricarboxylate transporter receptor subunit TctC
MQTRRRALKHLAVGGLAAAHVTSPSLSRAQSYPDRPVSLVVPFPPGGTTDVLARVVAEQLGKRLGVPVPVDNKPGANTIIGAHHVAKAKPDGHTLLIAAGSTMVLNPLLRKQLSYSPERELDIISLAGDIPLIGVVPAASPIRSLDDLIARVKEKRAPVTYASVGVGSTLHLAGELFEDFAGSPMTHVAYKGSVAAITDVVGGRVELMFDSPTTALPHVQSGRLRAIAVTSAARQSYLPDVPAVAERFPNYLAIVWYGLVAPKGLPHRRARETQVRDGCDPGVARVPAGRRQGVDQSGDRAVRRQDCRIRRGRAQALGRPHRQAEHPDGRLNPAGIRHDKAAEASRRQPFFRTSP